jgi:hypothetical protein
MWRTPAGDRVLTPGEWALVRAGLAPAWAAVEAARDTPGGPGITGVRAFDALQPGQQTGLLARVGRALSDAHAPNPPLTAVTEGALAAVLGVDRAVLPLELDGPGYLAGEPRAWRRHVLGAVGDPRAG